MRGWNAMKFILLSLASLILVNQVALGAVNSDKYSAKYYNIDKKKKQNQYISNGVITGGHQGHGFSLLNIRRKYYKSKKIDRVILDIGTATLKDHFGEPCYFHISIDESKRLLTIDLHQIYKSRFDFEELAKKIKSSPFIKSAKVVRDFDDKTTSIVAKLKSNVKIESYSIKGKIIKSKKRKSSVRVRAKNKIKTSRIVLDIKKI